ncbi:MAG: MGH1-like glycoside hydrolase domain-containing protein [Gemmatimonadales bacterium]
MAGAEAGRLEQDTRRESNWKRWGPYLAERQWGTVREDYSLDGNVWDYFSHDQARSRAYRWGEDGLLGITDRQGRLCFALALWNGRDPILKERLFGLTGPEGNHGEDVKEAYFYLDSTPTHSYLKALYKYPQAEFPYERLVRVNRERSKSEPEFELIDTGVFDDHRYFDVFAEYAKADTDDILVRITVANRGPQAATLHLLPTLWFRNTWSWGRDGEGYWPKPSIRRSGPSSMAAEHMGLGRFTLDADAAETGPTAEQLFTENETNLSRLFGSPNLQPYVKDAFHRAIVEGDGSAVNSAGEGTKAAFHYVLTVPAGGEQVVRLRLREAAKTRSAPFGQRFDRIFRERAAEADEFYAERTPERTTPEERRVLRQGYAGLLWSKQFYHYVAPHWLEGDPSQPAPPAGRREGRNADWRHVYNRDIISMPDKWEYPWFAAWDLAFHMIPFARIDPHFAKEQLLLLLREWYMHPNGQIPAYEFAFGDVNPPVHAWACWRVYKMTGPKGQRDRLFLERAFQKLLLNFTWWVNRKDPEGRNLFAGGFLGLDNIGVFDRSRPLPTGGHLEQADGTAWMAFYCNTMLSMALELASEDPVYEDLASKFFEHFIAIAEAINNLGGSGLWCEEDGFYYDQLHVDDRHEALRVRSLVGLMPLIAAEVLDERKFENLKGFRKRMNWFLENRRDVTTQIACMQPRQGEQYVQRLLAIPTRGRLERVLRYLLDESEFLSPHGIRSVSRVHHERPYELDVNGEVYRVDYVPAEGNTGLFGGNSNWRGPVWFPVNYLVLEALERYHHFYGNDLRVECPVGSGKMLNLQEVASELESRLAGLFLPDPAGRRPCHGDDARFAADPHWKDLVLFHEYFHGDNGRGVGASHQTGWTALVLRCIEDQAHQRGARAATRTKSSARLAGSRR